jgi:hypothetical protein
MTQSEPTIEAVPIDALGVKISTLQNSQAFCKFFMCGESRVTRVIAVSCCISQTTLVPCIEASDRSTYRDRRVRLVHATTKASEESLQTRLADETSVLRSASSRSRL